MNYTPFIAAALGALAFMAVYPKKKRKRRRKR